MVTNAPILADFTKSRGLSSPLMDKDEITKEFYTLKDVYNKGWIDDSEFQQRKRQLVDRVTNTTYGEIWNGPGSPSRTNTSIANINPTNAKANLLNKDNNGRKSFSEESHDLLLRENGQNNGANTKENGRNGSLNSSSSKSDSSKRASPDSNGKDPGFESSNPINVSPPNGTEVSNGDRSSADNIHENNDHRKKVSSIDALINKNSPPSTAQPTIVYPVASPGMMMDGIMPMKRMRRPGPTEPSNEDLPEAPVARQQIAITNENNTHKRNYEAALGALTSMSTHIQQDEYERQKKRQRLDPDSEVIVVPASMANGRDMHSGTLPVFIGQALNLGTLNEKDLVIKSLSEELRKTQTKLRDYEHLEREREIKRQEEERWINMVVDYPRPSMPIYQQAAPSAAYIQSLPTVPSLGNTVPSLSSISNQSGSSNTGLNPSGMPREPTSNGPAPPTVTIPSPPNPQPSVVNSQTNPIVMMSTIAPNVPGHKSPPPTSGTVSPVPGQVAIIPPMKMNGAPSFQLHVASQPPARVVYQRILKPFPQVQVLGPHQQYQNLYIEATLLRRDTHEEVPHLDGNTLVRVWNGFATFRKLKVTSTSQQSGTLFQLRFSLKQYDSANFKPMACNTVVSEPIEVFSHSQYLKQ